MMDNAGYAIDISGFHKRYGRQWAVRGLDLRVRRGTFFGFVGPNGAGKSTTINAMVGLIQPSSGTIRVAGYDIATQPLEVKARVGFMPEEPALYQRLTGREYLDFVGRMYGLKAEAVKERRDWLLKLLDLDGSKFIGTYSHGMRKKVSMAASLIHRPPVVILDEPFSGIDPTSASRVRGVLNEMVGDGHTVFFSSHVLETVERISGEIGVIHQGRLLASGTLREVLSQAGCAETASLEDAYLNLVEGREVLGPCE